MGKGREMERGNTLREEEGEKETNGEQEQYKEVGENNKDRYKAGEEDNKSSPSNRHNSGPH